MNKALNMAATGLAGAVMEAKWSPSDAVDEARRARKADRLRSKWGRCADTHFAFSRQGYMINARTLRGA